MSLTLTVLLSLISAGILAGRVYEILNLTDAATGFLIVKGVVLNPYILGLLVVMVICCGIIIFSQYRLVEPYYSHTSKYTAFIAGAATVVAGGFSLPHEVTAPFLIAGGIALIVIAAAGLGEKKSDYLVMLLLLVFTAGLCMDVVTFNVSTYHNTVFLQNVLSYICVVAFMLTMLKNVYMPSRFSRMMLYITGMLTFAVCSMMNLADIICYIISEGQSLIYLLTRIAFTLLGVYAFDNAVSAIPDKNEMAESSRQSAKNDNIAKQSYEIETISITDNNTKDTVEVQSDAEKTENTVKPAYNDMETDSDFETNELEKLFDAIAEEKSGKPQIFPQEDVVGVSIAEKCEHNKETDDGILKHKMFSELFGADAQSEISSHQQGIFSETRSFKKYAEPKLNETAPEYDMLKSMFRGEDTSQYEVAVDETVYQKEKRSLFGGKKQKTAKTKTDRIESVAVKSLEKTNKEEDIEPKQKIEKAKTETKKVVYKKPK